MKIIQTSFFLGKYDARALRYFIIVRPAFKDDKPLIAHEMVHIEQQKKYGIIRWGWKYIFDKEFRYQQELEAYRVQVKMGGLTVAKAAEFLVNNYGLKLDMVQVKKDLSV